MKFDHLSPHRARSFVPGDATLGQFSVFEKLGEELAGRPLPTVQSLEKFLSDLGEWTAVISDEGSKAYVRMSCQTDNPEYSNGYKHIVEHIHPKVGVITNKANKNYLQSPARSDFLARHPEFLIMDKRLETGARLFRDQNVPLMTQEALVGQRYQELMGGLTVNLRGTEYPIAQMAKFQMEPDRALRKEAFMRTAEVRLAVREKADDIFDELVDLRQQIAKNAGFENYRDYAYTSKCRFDYGPSEVAQFRQTIKKAVVPFLKDWNQKAASTMKQDGLRPWDTEVDVFGRPPLKPFTSTGHMLEQTQKIFDDLDPQLAGWFRSMREKGLFDLDVRKGKAPGGYQTVFQESRMPFIFMNSVGIVDDLRTMLHEAGHAFHSFSTNDHLFYDLMELPMEFCEVASMAMELLALPHLGHAFSDQSTRQRALEDQLLNVLKIYPHIARIDGFQDWVYTAGNPSRQQRSAYFGQLMDQFSTGVDWSGLEEIRDTQWQRQLHVFLYPFYYIEYGIAQMGALQVWRNARKDPQVALSQYKQALAQGGKVSLPQLFKKAGGNFNFGEEVFAPLVQEVRKEIHL